MNILPSIDLLNGKVVRLQEGDPNRATVYYDDPIRALEHLESDGATWAHIVDLNGALGIGQNQHQLIAKIIERANINIEVGGGIRTRETAERLLLAGADRIVLGTAAIGDPDFIRSLGIPGEKIVLGLDFKNGKVMTHGWVAAATVSFDDLVGMAEAQQVAALLVTDITRDGMLHGPNFETYRMLLQRTKLEVIASGGISGESDLLELARIGVPSAVVGKAYYEGKIDLRRVKEMIL